MCLFEMVVVQVCIAEGMNKCPRLEPGHPGHHVREQSITGDVEWDTQKDIRRALVQLTRQVSLGNIELEQAMARRQRHAINIRGVPCGDHQPAGIGIGLDAIDDIGDLIDRLTVSSWPTAPLVSIDRSKVARVVGPFVPDAYALVLEIFYIGVASEEPEQLIDDRAQMKLFGGHQREAVRQVKPHLVPEHAARAGAGSVVLLDAFIEDAFQEVVILVHVSSVERQGTIRFEQIESTIWLSWVFYPCAWRLTGTTDR